MPVRIALPGLPPTDVELDATTGTDRTTTALAATLRVLPDSTFAACIEAHDPLVAGATIGPIRRSRARWELVALDGPEAGRWWPIPDGDTRIGRSAAVDIVVGDPTVSREHCRITIDADACVVTDAESQSGTLVDGIDADTGVVVTRPPVELRLGCSRFALGPVGPRPSPDRNGRIAHNRPPRIPPVTPAAVHLPAPPTRPSRVRFSMVGAVLPLASGVVLMMLTGHPAGLALGLLTPAVLGGQWILDRRRGATRWSSVRTAYRAQLAEVEATAQAQAERWRADRRHHLAEPALLVQRVRYADPTCWDRRPGGGDFGIVRIAADDPAAALDVHLTPGGDPALHAEAARLAEDLTPVRGIPVTINVLDGPVGVTGDDRYATLAWVTVALAATHSPRDLRIAVCAGADTGDDDAPDSWAFAAWLPHTGALPTLAAPPRAVPTLCARTRARADALLHAIDALVQTRTECRVPGTRSAPEESIIVIVPDGRECDQPALARVGELGPAVGVHLIVGGARPADLPGSCTTLVSCGEHHTMLRTPDGRTRTALELDALPPAVVAATARDLAALLDATVGSDGRDLPRQVPLDAGLDTISADAVVHRWARSRAGAPLGAPVGIGVDGPEFVDLRVDGPHALVAGTTGSGKSALLQSLVAGFAASHPPDRVNFVLIDYKGGAAFGPCTELPHVVGLVTDLDDGGAHRVLVALEAELRRREECIRDAGVADLAALEALPTASAPPNLCIVVDEFAALVRDVPAFVDGMVDLAQRGRSLGMHLVLATQKPAGVVSDRIRANTTLRIALRTADPVESVDIVGIPDAAHIPRDCPGRAIIARGPSDHRPFQSAFAGAPVVEPEPTSTVRPFDSGRELPPEPTPRPTATDTGQSELDHLIAAVRAAAATTASVPGPCPWLAPLPSHLRLGGIVSAFNVDLAPATELPIGRHDRPARRSQPVSTIDLDRTGIVLITGGAATGKSTTLTTIAAALALRHIPDSFQFHIVDDGSGVLRTLQDLPHCTATIALHNADACTHYLDFLERETARRRVLLQEHGALDWAGLPGEIGPPARVVVLLDGLNPLLAHYERLDAGRWYDLLLRLIGDSRAVGIHWCITSERRTGLPPILAAQAHARFDLGDPAAPEASGPAAPHPSRGSGPVVPGRAALDGTALQIAQLAPTPDEVRIELHAIARRSPHPMNPIRPYTAPDRLGVAAIGPGPTSHHLALGRNEHGDNLWVDLRRNPLLVCGPPGSGRSTVLTALASQWADPTTCVRIEGHHLDAIAALCDATLAPGAARTASLVLIDDADLLNDRDAASHLEELVRRSHCGEIALAVACDPFTVARSFAPWVGQMKRNRQALLLQPTVAQDGDAFGLRLTARPGQVFAPGWGYLIERGRATVVQCAVPPRRDLTRA